jgi:hypothetical protein
MTGTALAPELIFTFGNIQLSYWRTTIFATSVTSILTILLFTLSDRTATNVILALTPFLILLFGSQVLTVLLGGWIWQSDTEVIVMSRVKSGAGIGALVVTCLVSLFGFLYLFSTITYPLIKPEIGGGTPQLVQFYSSSADFKQLELYGIPLTSTVHADVVLAQNVTQPTFTVPLYLLGESTDSYIVSDYAQGPSADFLVPRTRFGVSFQIPKKDISGVLHLNRADILNPIITLVIALLTFGALMLAGRAGIYVFWPLMSKLGRKRRIESG